MEIQLTNIDAACYLVTEACFCLLAMIIIRRWGIHVYNPFTNMNIHQDYSLVYVVGYCSDDLLVANK